MILFEKNTFLDNVKLRNLTPVHEKDERNGKENYGTVSSFPYVQYLNNLSRGFSKIHYTMLINLPKAYVCLPHDLLIARFEAYGIDKSRLILLLSYLSNRGQCIKVTSSYSDCYNIFKAVLQGFILGPLLLNLFIDVTWNLSGFFFFKEK